MESEVKLQAMLSGMEVEFPGVEGEDAEPVKLSPEQERAVDKRLAEFRKEISPEWRTKS